MDGPHIGILLPFSILTYSVCVIIRMSCCIRLRNVVMGQTSADFWRHIDFSRWRSRSRKSTSEFRFSDYIRSKWWKSLCTPNGDEIPQSIVEIKLLPVWENGQSPYWNSISWFNFDLGVVIGMRFCISMPNFVSVRRSPEELWRNIDFSRWRP